MVARHHICAVPGAETASYRAEPFFIRRRAADGGDRARIDVEPARASVRRDQPRPRADRHPRYLRCDASHQTERDQHRAGRAGHRAGDESRRSRLLLSGGTGIAVGPPDGTYERSNSPRLFRTLNMLWLGTIVEGVLLGGLYALFAAGLSLVFGIMRLVNLAHGDLIVLAAFAILSLTTWLGFDPFLAALLAMPVMFAAGFALQYVLLNRTLGRDLLPPLLVTFGLSIVIQNGLLEAFTADSRRLRLGAIETASIDLGGNLAIGVMPLLTLGSAVAVILLLNLLFYRTALGRAFRAASDDLEIAQLMGIDHHRIYAIAMGIAMLVATIAALYLGIRANFDPTIGPARLIYAFEAVIIGGLGSLWGTLAGGVIIGLAQTVGAKMNPEWQILAGHIAFLAVVVLRPRGLFPRALD